jgi:hypothetical protein
MNWSKFSQLFQATMQTEEAVLPIFIHNPNSQRITAAVMVSESIFGNMFGLFQPPAAPAAPVPAVHVSAVASEPAPVAEVVTLTAEPIAERFTAGEPLAPVEPHEMI